ncbi:MAG: cbb3-type cytochrome c oxidase subunit 3 [Proteobacteria bacterium]|nr:cbb3-type cytochrome c oxidase subunit 3 [Pseudomonadota bacterium]
MTYQDVSAFAQTYGLVYLLLLFIGMVIYALWPGNRQRFDAASKIPLRED